MTMAESARAAAEARRRGGFDRTAVGDDAGVECGCTRVGRARAREEAWAVDQATPTADATIMAGDGGEQTPNLIQSSRGGAGAATKYRKSENA